MPVIRAREAKNRFGRLLDSAQRQPVTITKKDRPVSVVVSKEDFDAMQRGLEELRSVRETAYLTASPANRARLLESIEQDPSVDTTLERLRQYED